MKTLFKSKSLMVMLVCMCCCLATGISLFCVPVWAETQTTATADLWTDYAVAPALGDGTETAPYQIKSPENLAWVARETNAGNYDVANAYFKQTVAIYLNGHDWVPIGTEEHPFYGEYNAAWNEVYNMTTIATDYAGLFGYCVGNIKSLDMISAKATGYLCVGAYVGYLKGSLVSDSPLMATVVANSSSTVYAGGIVGYLNTTSEFEFNSGPNSKIKVTARSSGGEVYAGGVVGYLNSTEEVDILAYGAVTVTSTSTGDVYAGGAIGYLSSTSYVDIKSYVGVTATSTSTGTSKSVYAGGCIGARTGDSTSLFYTRWLGMKLEAKASSGEVYAGGSCGYLSGNVGRIYFEASTSQTVNANGSSKALVGGYVGGFACSYIGWYSNKIYNLNSMTLTAQSSSGFAHAGGFAGQIYASFTLPISVEVSSCTIKALSTSSSAYAGGLIGLSQEEFLSNNYTITVSDCTIEVSSGSSCSAYSGGVIGAGSGDLSNCKISDLNITLSKYGCTAGGIIGKSVGTIISHCDVSVNVVVGSSQYHYVGGILGEHASGSLQIIQCEVTTSVTLQSSAQARVGGIIGGVRNGIVSLEGVYVKAMNVSLSADNLYLGGAIGDCSGSSSCCVTISNIYIHSDDWTNSSSFSYIGGFIGQNFDSRLQLSSSYFEGTLCDGSSAGSVIGFLGSVSTTMIADCLVRTTSSNSTWTGNSAGTLTKSCLVLENASSRYYTTDTGDWSNWAIVNGKPLLKSLFHIASAGEECSGDILGKPIADGGLGYTELT
ncbi:MAG: hypothetical protein IJY90_03590 [Clostridia bacterium]|nr:hypothetical protein [Clostridia bacterium]